MVDFYPRCRQICHTWMVWVYIYILGLNFIQYKKLQLCHYVTRHRCRDASLAPRCSTAAHRIHDEDSLQLLEKGLCYLHQTGWSGFCCRRCWKLSRERFSVKGAEVFLWSQHGRNSSDIMKILSPIFEKNRSKQTLGPPVLRPFQRTDSSPQRPRALGPSNGDLATVRLEFQSRTSCWSPGRGGGKNHPWLKKRWILWMAKGPSPR